MSNNAGVTVDLIRAYGQVLVSPALPLHWAVSS
jgi:hypothetical protein